MNSPMTSHDSTISTANCPGIDIRHAKGPFINYVTLFSALFCPSLPVTKCHTRLPPPNNVTPVQTLPPPPKKLGFLITTIRLFTVIM